MTFTNENSSSALLTNAQREWLAGGGENPTTDANRMTRSRTRKRLRRALADFLLLSNLPAEEIEQIFGAPSAEEVDGMAAALEFIYRGTHDGVRVLGIDSESTTESFESMLKRAIRNAEATMDDSDTDPMLFDVEFNNNKITAKKNIPSEPDIERIGAKIESGELNRLSRKELAWFIRVYQLSGELDTDAAAETYQHLRSEFDMDTDEE